jgi:DNA replication protein DnaC
MTNRYMLRRLPNSEFEEAERLAKLSGIPLDQCPTCLAEPIQIEPGVYGFENGTYRFRGEEHECDCDTQMALRKHYLLANIGDQYMRLDWRDYDGAQSVRDAVALYLDNWPSFKLNGMGVEFSSSNLGVGKTFAATHIGKELIKRGELVYFKPFLEIISLYEKDPDYRHREENHLRDTTVLILDEVVPPISSAQGQLFATKFEELIRHRTNFNRVTIMTTNLAPEKLLDSYPRTYSLLEAKQMRIEMAGSDARQGKIAWENVELAANSEVRPIT